MPRLLKEMGVNYANATSWSSCFVVPDPVDWRSPESSSYVPGFGSFSGHDHALHGGAGAERGRYAERSLETG